MGGRGGVGGVSRRSSDVINNGGGANIPKHVNRASGDWDSDYDNVFCASLIMSKLILVRKKE